MKKALLTKLMLLLCALTAGSSSVWAAVSVPTPEAGTFVIDFYDSEKLTSTSGSGLTSNNYLNFVGVPTGVTKADVVSGVTTDGTVQYGKNGGLTIGTSSANSNSVTFTIGGSYVVTKCTVYATKYEDGCWLINGNAASSGSIGEKGAELSTITSPLVWNFATGQTSLAFTKDNGSGANQKRLTIYRIVCEYSVATTPTCATPTISPASGAVLSGTEVTLTTTTEGASIRYTMGENPADPTASSTLYDPNNKPTITAATTIKAIAVKEGSNNSTVASAEYTILSQKTIAQVRSQATGAVYTRGIITYINGKHAYIQDNTAAIDVYQASANITGVVLGDEITVVGTLDTYQGLLEIASPTITKVDEGKSVNPTTITIAEINTDKAGSNALQCMLVQIVDAEVTAVNGTSVTIKQGEATITVYGIAAQTCKVKDKITLTGNVGSSSNTKATIVNPTNINVTEYTAPIINANNVTIEFDATSGEIAYTITNSTTATLSAAKTTGDWINNVAVDDSDPNNKKVTFTATANDGAERTGTITLSYTDAEDKVVIVTQKKCGIATLPFAFDGGKADIENTFGLTQNGLGSDYNASPKLKFDGTGDYVILRTNAAIGTLVFDIKGNSFSDGTFKVQTSTNGTSYTDLETYTTLDNNNAQTEKFNIGSSVRYVKWIYTNKANGNVALGNIRINCEVVTITNAKYATFASVNDVDYTGSGVTAYTAKVNGDYVTLTEIQKVPANTPVVIYKDVDATTTVTLPLAASTDAVGDNDLLVSNGTIKGDNIYALANKTAGVGFYKVKSTINVPKGKCYIEVNAPTNPAPEFLGFNGETTEIAGVRRKMEDVSGKVYNLAGQRVAQPTKGLYIVNGKKVIVK